MPTKNYPVQSSAIARLDYDDEAGTVYFTFHRGGSYSIQMEEIEVARWAGSESPGGYFNSNVKGKY